MKPSMEKPFDQSKRRLLKGGAVLASGALGAGLPASAVLASTESVKKSVYKAPLFDPSLENYPGYSTYVPIPRSAELATAGHNLLDTQFII